MACGGCYHYRFGRCKNKSASTYNMSFPSDSEECQMYLTNILLPLGIIGAIVVGLLSIPAYVISQSTEIPGFSSGSDNDGFEI